MKESEQFDDLTVTDEHMPSPEVATMSLEDYHAGTTPDFEPLHEEDADKDFGGFHVPEIFETFSDESFGETDSCPDCVVTPDQNLNENSFSFYGVEEYLLPKN